MKGVLTMHDTFLLDKISKSLNGICEQSKVRKVDRLTVIVNYNSHVSEENLIEYLKQNNANLLGSDFRVKVQREDIEDQTAIIHSIQGETAEE
jgi:hypothetical protein